MPSADRLLGGRDGEVDAQPLDAGHGRRPARACRGPRRRTSARSGRRRVSAFSATSRRDQRSCGCGACVRRGNVPARRASVRSRARPASRRRRSGVGQAASWRPSTAHRPGSSVGLASQCRAKRGRQGKGGDALLADNAALERSAMSTWKWFLWALLASGPSTVPKIVQAARCTPRRKSMLPSWQRGRLPSARARLGFGPPRRAGREQAQGGRLGRRCGYCCDARDGDGDARAERNRRGCTARGPPQPSSLQSPWSAALALAAAAAASACFLAASAALGRDLACVGTPVGTTMAVWPPAVTKAPMSMAFMRPCSLSRLLARP